MDRRSFLVASSTGFAGFAFGKPASPTANSEAPKIKSKAKSTILFFLCGGASHIDTWDMKPNAPSDYRGPFQPIQTSAPGVQLCEHLPLLAKQAHHLAVLNSVDGTVNTNDHHGGYYHNLTGHAPDQSFVTLGNNRTPTPEDWPFMGSVIASRRPQSNDLPNAITVPYKPSRAPYTRPGQFAARIGVEHDPLYVHAEHSSPLKFDAPALHLQGNITPNRLNDRLALLRLIDSAKRTFEQSAVANNLHSHNARAVLLLTSASTTSAFNVDEEPANVRERYGTSVNAMSLLLARRLVEAEVPFITVFWRVDRDRFAKKCRSGGGWDTHGNNFNCLKEDLLPEFDRGFSALIADLAERGMLEETLLLVTSEMGRKPKIGDPRSGGKTGAGRDHWTYCLTDLMAGGGIQGGQTFGKSDRYGEYPLEHRVTPAHVTKTVYHAMGIHDLTAMDELGRPYNLLDEGDVLSQLF